MYAQQRIDGDIDDTQVYSTLAKLDKLNDAEKNLKDLLVKCEGEIETRKEKEDIDQK